MKLSKYVFSIIVLAFLIPSGHPSDGLSIDNIHQNEMAISYSWYNSTFVHPCERIAVETLKEIFNLEGIEVGRKESGSSFPTCIYVWEGGNKKLIEVGGNKTEIDIECNVTIVIVDMKVSKSNYDASVKSYSDATELSAVGDYAVWSDKRKQMTVLVGKNLFHVHVDVFPEVELNKEKAIALSEIIVKSF